MRPSTVSCVDGWYAELFGIDHTDRWQRVPLDRTRLGDYEGHYVSMPTAGGDVQRWLETQDA
jgi:hypothetical protein